MHYTRILSVYRAEPLFGEKGYRYLLLRDNRPNESTRLLFGFINITLGEPESFYNEKMKPDDFILPPKLAIETMQRATQHFLNHEIIENFNSNFELTWDNWEVHVVDKFDMVLNDLFGFNNAKRDGWKTIILLFAFVAAFARRVDAIRRLDISVIITAVSSDFLQRCYGGWIEANGGWDAFSHYVNVNFTDNRRKRHCEDENESSATKKKLNN